MKKDISNTVDLDELFKTAATQTNITIEIATPTKQREINIDALFEIVDKQTSVIQKDSNELYVDFTRILSECSYKLPKGYPTVVDGVFTEREEIIIVNEALEAEGLPTLPLPIQEASVDIEQTIQNAILKSDTYKTLLLPSLGLQPYKDTSASTSKSTVWRIELAGPAGRDISRIDAVSRLAKELTTKLGRFADVKIATNKKAFTISAQGHKYMYVLKPAKKEGSTDTNAKEGLSVVMSYYPQFLPSITKENVQAVSKDLIKFIRSKDSSVAGLSEITIKSCLDYLTKIVQTKDAKVLKEMAATMNQNSSHSKTFDSFFQNNKNFYIDRDQLFDQIRKVGSKITGYPADKWCPGDVYFIKNGSESSILDTLRQAEKLATNNSEQGLAMINSLFSDRYFEPETKKPIVAVSLKMEKAQAGKLKSGFDEYANAPKEYSLDGEELKYDAKQYKDKIKQYRTLFQKQLGYGDVDIDWNFVNLDKVTDLKILKFKYAAYKAMYFILTKIAHNKIKQFDDALVSLAAYGLGVISKSKKFGEKVVNPPFFKVIAKTNGEPSQPILFKGGQQLGICNVDGSLENPRITIKDSEKFAGLTVEMGMTIGSDKYDLLIAFRSNGMSQLTVELQRAKHID